MELRAYLWLRPALQPLMRALLRRRLQRGKEDPARFQEKLGVPTQPRPNGKLVWIHAVGLGEVLALRPLVDSLQRTRPGLHVLLTSSASSSAQVIAKNLGPDTHHQMLPLDGPAFMRRFLDHWRPDLSIWSEQDLWPGAIQDIAARGIPLAYVNARMNAKSLRKRARLSGLYRDTLRCFALIAAQDTETAANLRELGAGAVRETGSLKPAARPLTAESAELSRLRHLLAERRIWVAASTHPDDEAALIPAQARLFARSQDWLLILTPRLPGRSPEIAKALQAAGLPFAIRSLAEDPGPDKAVWLADTFGELGLWYRLAESAFIGASLGDVGGHNPWEAICLGVPVLSGPHTRNFQNDYEKLRALGLVQEVAAGAGADLAIAKAVARTHSGADHEKALLLVNAARAETDRLARDLISLMETAG
ncbi:3-deoxy-D-manno-octulosonic acid transferase [Rhodobacter maris]|uniref:3-deoxy-D-manno-octulosonic acid transferase n=1 Tax=Rhodobacter maris TaxID=446682 RepID=A0A285S0U3_9RHOB|nr:glycosyltransferase N-terminal domain-containing protein [Rhodobacter maris]SOB99986.1 3-deoxy-D-manno-octulosonic-acid transferase [Rhodobacter maris]